MNKPLTIEELKSLKVGDWVWLKDIEQNEDNYAIIINSKEKFGFLTINRHFAFDYEAYGKTWLAYKNKEQAENETCCMFRSGQCHLSSHKNCVHRDSHDDMKCTTKGVIKPLKHKGEIVELPCIRPIVFEDGNGVTMYELAYFDRYGMIQTKMYRDDQLHEAGRRLAELKGETS